MAGVARRDHVLDALRGWAILGMALSGLVPFETLPAWMYHAQLPPPTHALNQKVFGITWVDLVFPFFLLAMGAAIPLYLSRVIEQGADWKQILGGILKRYALLVVFSHAVFKLRPDKLPPVGSDTLKWLLGLLFFFAIACAMIRLPKSWAQWQTQASVFGWTVMLGGIAWVGWSKPNVFGNEFDIIIMVLANMALTGSLIWWLTREKPAIRLVILVFATGFFIASGDPGPAKVLWNWEPWKWTFKILYHKYLMLIIPGFILGDWILNGGDLTRVKEEREVIAWLAGLAIPVCLIGLLSREVWWTFVACCVLAAVCLAVAGWDSEAQTIHRWGWGLLLFGLFVEGFGDGGIRKDTTTLSYFYVTGGLGFLFYAFLSAWRSRITAPSIGFMALAGANPLLAYVAITNFIEPFVRLTTIEHYTTTFVFWLGSVWTWFTPAIPWTFAFYAVLQTLAIGLIAAWGTKKGLFVRA